MPIYETSFRIGCGRYIQERGALAKCGAEVLRLGKSALVIGDDKTLGVAGAAIERSLRESGVPYRVAVHNGTCNDEDATLLAEQANAEGLDVIVGVGGGVLMDFAKLCAFFAKRPVINVPTSSATCAACASLSVRYTREGKTVGSKHYENEVNAVIADVDVLAAQPKRLLLAGVFDALAKFLEIKQRYSPTATDTPLGLDYAFALSARSFAVLTEQTAQCVAEMERGEITPAVEQVLFTTLAATGVISGIARGSNQCALAHKFYETTRTLYPEIARPYLHGEIVGVGLLLQNHFNGEVENNESLLALMRENGMPCRITDVGVEASAAMLEEYYSRICNSSAIDKNNAQECSRFHESLSYLWGI